MKNPIIQINNVNKNYKNVNAVNDLSFEVSTGECFGLLGPNGAGKTTMMKVIYGMNSRDKVKGGDVNVMGYDPAVDEISIKYLSGIVQQEDNLDAELSVLQNLLIYAKFYGITKK
jgi:lipooligosaccharide transport system ATP-binding protein